MATATIVSADHDGITASAVFRVSEGGHTGTVEYVAETSMLDADGKLKNAATIRADLIAAAKAKRSAQIGMRTPIAGLPGSVSLGD